LCKSGKDKITVVAAGITLHEALKAYEMLKERGIMIRVIDLYSIKPLDYKTLAKAAKETEGIVVVEDHYEEGGVGEAVRSALGNWCCIPFIFLSVKKLPKSGKPEELLDYEGISAASIVKQVMTLVKKV
jgi:transketolase